MRRFAISHQVIVLAAVIACCPLVVAPHAIAVDVSKHVGDATPVQAAREPGAIPLTVADFDVSGSEGAKVEQVGTNWFRLTLGRAPQPTMPTRTIVGYPGEQEHWANWLRFQILRHAKGNTLRMDVEFPFGRTMLPFNHYDPCWSYDGAEWTYVPWQPGAVRCKSGTLLFPAFSQDKVLVATQLPMTLQDVEILLAQWREHPHVKVHLLGKSLQGRNLYRIEVTDPDHDIPRSRRWIHHVANQHPGEGVAQWYIAGMVRWFLSDEAAEARKRTIGHFTLMMNPDGVAHGWCRVNAQGVDMNRSFRLEGPDRNAQPHEAFIFQRDFEALMDSEAPVTTSWSMHSRGSAQLEPILVAPGPEIGMAVGSLDNLAETIRKHDPQKLVKVPTAYPEPTPQSYWDAGPHRKYGISNFLVEGGGGQLNKRQALDAGGVLMKALTEYYEGQRSP